MNSQQTITDLQTQVTQLQAELAELKSKTSDFCWVLVQGGNGYAIGSYTFQSGKDILTLRCGFWESLPGRWRPVVEQYAAMEAKNFDRARITIR